MLDARAGVRGGGAAEGAVLAVEGDCGNELWGAELYVCCVDGGGFGESGAVRGGGVEGGGKVECFH